MPAHQECQLLLFQNKTKQIKTVHFFLCLHITNIVQCAWRGANNSTSSGACHNSRLAHVGRSEASTRATQHAPNTKIAHVHSSAIWRGCWSETTTASECSAGHYCAQSPQPRICQLAISPKCPACVLTFFLTETSGVLGGRCTDGLRPCNVQVPSTRQQRQHAQEKRKKRERNGWNFIEE